MAGQVNIIGIINTANALADLVLRAQAAYQEHKRVALQMGLSLEDFAKTDARLSHIAPDPLAGQLPPDIPKVEDPTVKVFQTKPPFLRGYVILQRDMDEIFKYYPAAGPFPANYTLVHADDEPSP